MGLGGLVVEAVAAVRVEHRGLVERVATAQDGADPLHVHALGPVPDQQGGDRVAGEVGHRAGLGHEPVDAHDDPDAVGQVGALGRQEDADRVLGLLRGAPRTTLPKGLGAETLDAVVGLLRHRAVSAGEAAEALGMARVTARRYLEHLADVRAGERVPRYRGPGRPELEYRWLEQGQAGS